MTKNSILRGCILYLIMNINSYAAVVDFGLSQYDDGIEVTVQAFIDNFTPLSNLQASGIYFDTIEAYGAPNGNIDGGKPWDGTLDVRFYADNGNDRPDFASEVVATGSLVSKVKTGTRSDGWYDYYAYSMLFDAPITFTGNQQYWLGIHLSTNYNRDAIFVSSYTKDTWDPILSNFSDRYYSGDYSNSWSKDITDWTGEDSPFNVAFALESVPEPSTSFLMGLGIMSALLRRIRNLRGSHPQKRLQS